MLSVCREESSTGMKKVEVFKPDMKTEIGCWRLFLYRGSVYSVPFFVPANHAAGTAHHDGSAYTGLRVVRILEVP